LGDILKYYAVAEINITDPGWIRDYVAHVTAMVERRGGRYLARTPQIEKVEGNRAPQGFLLIEWPSKEAADEFYESEEYRPYRESRQAGTTGELFLIAGEDVNGVARMDGQTA
jgi:uncharacterized protein (DUF1330 family)